MRKPKATDRRPDLRPDDFRGGPLLATHRARNRRREKESRVHMVVYVSFFVVLVLTIVYLLVIAAPA